MSERLIHCCKLNIELPGLDKPPFNNELGQKIFETVSKEAWGQWLNQQTMLINEYRLNVIEKSSRDFLEKEMNLFLFSDKDTKPPGFTEK
jgi:Fe-S cluster biosynthesis and repair protein YggX